MAVVGDGRAISRSRKPPRWRVQPWTSS